MYLQDHKTCVGYCCCPGWELNIHFMSLYWIQTKAALCLPFLCSCETFFGREDVFIFLSTRQTEQKAKLPVKRNDCLLVRESRNLGSCGMSKKLYYVFLQRYKRIFSACLKCANSKRHIAILLLTTPPLLKRIHTEH